MSSAHSFVTLRLEARGRWPPIRSSLPGRTQRRGERPTGTRSASRSVRVGQMRMSGLFAVGRSSQVAARPRRRQMTADPRGSSNWVSSVTRTFRGTLRARMRVLWSGTWRKALVLVAGAILAQGPRTVASALRAAGLGAAPGFGSYHRALSRRRWSGRVGWPRACCWSSCSAPSSRPARRWLSASTKRWNAAGGAGSPRAGSTAIRSARRKLRNCPALPALRCRARKASVNFPAVSTRSPAVQAVSGRPQLANPPLRQSSLSAGFD